MLGLQSRRRKSTIGKAFNHGVLLMVGILTIALSASCNSPNDPAPEQNTFSLRLQDGVAWFGNAQPGSSLEKGQAVSLSWQQAVWSKSEPATLQIGEADRLRLAADSRFRIVAPIPPSVRPLLFLEQGDLRYEAGDNEYGLGAHFQLASEMRILVSDLLVRPNAPGAVLELRREEHTAILEILKGEVEAEGNGVSATLYADWQAIVRPGEPMEVISSDPNETETPTVTPTVPETATPTTTPTPTRTSPPRFSATPTLTPTWTATPTLTATLTPTPTATSPPRPLATNTLVPTLPPPTATPLPPPPPTQPPPPPPTAVPPTPVPPTPVPPTSTPEPPTPVPPTPVPPTSTTRPLP